MLLCCWNQSISPSQIREWRAKLDLPPESARMPQSTRTRGRMIDIEACPFIGLHVSQRLQLPSSTRASVGHFR